MCRQKIVIRQIFISIVKIKYSCGFKQYTGFQQKHVLANLETHNSGEVIEFPFLSII